MSKYRVMLRDNMAVVAKEILEASGQIEVVVDNDKATNEPKALAGIIGDFDGLAIRSGTKVTAEVLTASPRLKVVGRAGIGVDNVDVNTATSRGIVVMNAPGGNTVTTAEHALSLLLALARHIPQATASLREGKWEKKKFMGVELMNKTLGIIGLGQIGRVVADRARGLKMKVIAADPYVTEAAAKAIGVELVLLDELLARADFITLHVPRLEETKNLIRKETLEKMKPGVRIVNCSRGDVVNLDDLYEALNSGRVAGAALDVFPKEPPDPSLPILQHPNVIFTPHLGASTGEAQEKVAEMIARQIADYLLHGVIQNAVNFPSLPAEVMAQLQPYLNLAQRMGAIMGQLVGPVQHLTITYCGEVTSLDTRPITHALLKGLLSAHTDEPVNYISAPVLAKAKGIVVQETVSQASPDYASLVKVKLSNHDSELTEIWGTLFGKKYPRVVRLGQVYMDALPEGFILVIQNHDRPGVIGNVGSALGRHQINIGRFQLGRKEGRAVCLVNVDTKVPENVLAELRALPNIISVQQVYLD